MLCPTPPSHVSVPPLAHRKFWKQTEPKDYVDAGTFYMYTAALGVIILVATVVYRMQNSKTGGKRRTRRQERGTEVMLICVCCVLCVCV